MIAKTEQPDAAARVDRDLVASAYRKLTNHQELTRQQRSALKKHEKQKEEQLRRQCFCGIDE